MKIPYYNREDHTLNGLFRLGDDFFYPLRPQCENGLIKTKKTVLYTEHSSLEALTHGVQNERMESNPGRKATAKLMLNSFWGKFGERPNKTQVHTVTSPADLYAKLISPVVNNPTIRKTADGLESPTKIEKQYPKDIDIRTEHIMTEGEQLTPPPKKDVA